MWCKRSDNHHGFPFSLHNVTMSFVFRWQTYWEFRSISGPWAVESMLHIRTDSFVSFLMLGMYLPFPPCGTCWPSRWLLMTTPLPWWTWQVAWELVGETVVSEVTVVRWISTVSRRRDDWWNYVWNCRCKWSEACKIPHLCVYWRSPCVGTLTSQQWQVGGSMSHEDQQFI